MIKKFTLGPLETNCYIMNKESDAFIVDPGDNPDIIINYLIDNKLDVKGIVLTHGHIDHIGAVEAIVKIYDCKVYANRETIELAGDPYLNLSTMFSTPYALTIPIVEVKDEIDLLGYHLQWLLLPGHCKGSSMIYLKAEGIMFSGDVLFKDSIGRYDFPSSSIEETRQSMQKIKEMNLDCKLYPGHGENSTMQRELACNMFLK